MGVDDRTADQVGQNETLMLSIASTAQYVGKTVGSACFNRFAQCLHELHVEVNIVQYSQTKTAGRLDAQ